MLKLNSDKLIKHFQDKSGREYRAFIDKLEPKCFDKNLPELKKAFKELCKKDNSKSFAFVASAMEKQPYAVTKKEAIAFVKEY